MRLVHRFSKGYNKLENGKSSTSTLNLNERNFYIQSASLNGKPYTKCYISHSDILKGGELVFNMGPQPNKHGVDMRISETYISEFIITPVPSVYEGNHTFLDSTVSTHLCAHG